MRVGLLVSVLLLTLLSVISGAAIWIGRQQRLPDRLAMLHFDQCAPPCWIGIVPGKTTRADAIQTFTAYYNTVHDYTIHAIQTGYFEITNVVDPSRKFRVSFSADNLGVVKSI